jgi:hypothetical protein
VPEFGSTWHAAVRVCVTVPQPLAGANAVNTQAPVPVEQEPKPLAVQEKVQPLKSLTVCIVAGAVPALAQKLASTVEPSDCKQLTVRVCVAMLEQVSLEGPKAPAFQE